MLRVLRPFMQCSRPAAGYSAWPMFRVWIEPEHTTRWMSAVMNHRVSGGMVRTRRARRRGVRVLNDQVVRALRIPEYVIEAVAEKERQELTRRERLYRGDGTPP
jgi:hypothetical protein